MKKIVLFIMILLTITGCNNKEESEKNNYLKMKTKLLEVKKYTSKDKIPCEITINVNRINKEQISYKVTLTNAKEDMNEIKAIVVHNYYTENIFPTIGLFNKKRTLKQDNKEDSIILKDKIETTDDIDELNLKLKILIEYKTNDNKIKDIYYKTT